MPEIRAELEALMAELRANVERTRPGFWASPEGQRVEAALNDPARVWDMLRAQKWGHATGWRIRAGRG